jgi:hypothetical protein
MTITMDNQAVMPTHRWRGIASSIIGATSIIVTLLLVGIVVSKTALPRHMIFGFQVLSIGMLCANLIGIALGFLGAKDRLSRKFFPLLGLAVNVAILTVFVAAALVGRFV